MSLDLHKLEHLVMVAEQLNFTRAAQRLHMTQQALSSSIRALERDVGVALLDRSGGQVSLLPAGQALVDDGRVLRGAANSALRRARRIGRGERELLRIGHTPAVTSDEMGAVFARLRAPHPEIETQARQVFPDELQDQVLAGDLELGLTRAMTPPPEVSTATVGHQQLRVAVRAGHRLADRRQVSLPDLRDECLMVWGHPGHSGYTDLLLGECRRAGFEPRFERNPSQGTPPTTAVIDTEHVAFVTNPPGPSARGRVQVLELTPAVFVPLRAMWLKHTTSEARELFIAALNDTFPRVATPAGEHEPHRVV